MMIIAKVGKHLSKRLYRSARRCYLNFRLREARIDITHIEAEVQTAPRRLALMRAYILDLANELDKLEGAQ